MAKPNNEQVMSKRDAMSERLKKKYPDQEFGDDEALFGRINDDYDDYDKQIDEYKGREQSFVEMFNADPRSAQFINNWRNGADPVVELTRQFGDAFREALDDPEKLDALAEANKEYLERVAKSKELVDQYEQNIDASIATLDQFQADNGLTDEQADEVMDFLKNIFNDAIIGKFSRESMEMALKAINHDEDVASADADAEVRGRNAKINETLRKRQAGDGTSPLNGKSVKGSAPAGPDMGALGKMGGDDIWSRGGEKRRRMS